MGQGRSEVTVDVEIAAYVGLRNAEFAGAPKHPVKRGGAAQPHYRGGRQPGGAAVPGDEPHRQLTADQRPHRSRESRRNA